MDEAKAKALRAPFPREIIGKLPKPTKKENPKGKCHECGGWHGLPAVHLDYVGHAAVTDRLLLVDPEWTWVPMAKDTHGFPMLDKDGGLWINLTVCGVTRPGYGDATMGHGMKEVIGDALRNGAMRFGVALDLWSKEDLKGDENDPEAKHGAKGSMQSPPPDQGHPETKERPRTSPQEKFKITMASWATALGPSYKTILGAHGYESEEQVPDDQQIRHAILADFQGALNELRKGAAQKIAEDNPNGEVPS